jgi:hypothetical protein
MSELEKLLLREWFLPASSRSQVIYHYTTAAGLIGILKSNSIRGSNAAFLNDTSEILYGGAVCKAVIESMATDVDADRELLDRLGGIFDLESTPSEVFITSFTMLDDVLGQWRGYGSEAGRYSLGFRVSQFSERDVLRIPQPVDYDPESQKKRVRHAIELTRDHLRQNHDDRATLWREMAGLGRYLRRLACIFKHPGFRDEQEWRSVSSFNEMDSVQHVAFEAIDGVPRPYMNMLQGSRESNQLPIVEVRVGAAKRLDSAVFATSLLLRSLGYSNVVVTKTQIPMAP